MILEIPYILSLIFSDNFFCQRKIKFTYYWSLFM